MDSANRFGFAESVLLNESIRDLIAFSSIVFVVFLVSLMGLVATPDEGDDSFKVTG